MVVGACICLTYEYAYIYIYIGFLISEFSLKPGECCMHQGMGNQSCTGSAVSTACPLFVGKLLGTT